MSAGDMWTPERVRRAIDAHDRGDFAESAALMQAVTRRPYQSRGLRAGRATERAAFALASGFIRRALAFVPPVAPWHPFADAPRGEP